uniref:Monodehydroascorbate reductase n=1 Tax=Tanacetum cinerariifolium TaxID=118510 RepID=A0A699GJ07_TANCI|nr:hypothetical protein [Tanacetum cinerariifolium]
MDEALVPHAKRLRIGRSNFRLLSDIKSKESTLQLVYDVMSLTPFFKAFLVTADVPEIHMHEFWATATVHHHAIRFKMDNKKHIVTLESFRDMLHICPRVHGQSFAKPQFEEEFLTFIRFLGHSAAIMTLTDVNINKLYQPWRFFTAIINKCLTRKSSGYDSLRLSQAQILWGLYHKRNVDYAYLMWEDFVYQVEHKDHKKSNKMYYPRFTKVIIHHFMSKDPSIPRRNKVNWHYVRDDHMFSTIKLESNAYKEYYAVATGAAPPKPKASVWKTRSSSDTTITPPTATAGPRLTTSKKGKQAAKASKAKSLSVLSKEELSWNSTEDEGDDEGKDGDDDEEDDGDDGEEGDGDDDDEDDDGEEGDNDVDQKVKRDDEKDDEEEGGDDEQEYDEEEYDEETRDEETFDPILKTPKNSDDKGNGKEDLGLNIDREEGHDEEEEEDELYRDVNINQVRGIQATLEVEDSHVTLTPVNPDDQQQSSSTSSQFMTSMLNLTLDVVQVAVQLQSDKLREEAQKENDEFLKTIDENMQKIIKEQVKEHDKTSYAVAADLSKMEQKKILIEKMEGNKSIQRSDEQRNLYKALVEAYESDKNILDTYRETVMLKRHRDGDADKDEEPSAGPDRGYKRRREGKETESASAPTKTDTRSAGRSTQGTKSRQASASKSATVEEPMQTTFQMEEPSHPEFGTGAEDQPIVKSSQHPESELAKQTNSRSYFNELMDTPLDFSNFLINLLNVDTLTPELLASPTYELLKGSCKSLVELEYYLEDVYKATTDQLDWVNPEGQQYPHNLLKPLPLIPNNRGRHVIPFDYFINNNLEYLRGGASSRKYTTFVTKTKAVDYGHIKWMEDMVPRTIWIQEPIDYDKHALWGVSHWGRRIIAVTELKIVEWHNYKYLDWITKHRDPEACGRPSTGDRTLIDVRTALDDRLKGIQMQYLPQSIWRKSDKDRAAAMIQAIDKRLKPGGS